MFAFKQLQMVLLILLVLVISPASHAQNEPLFEQLSSTFKKKYLSIGALLQTVGDFQIDRSFAGNNGFNISNFRVNLGGELDDGFGYFLQANFINSASILDARMYYRLSGGLTLDIGLYKSPFSAEFLIGAASIDFVNRSQAVTALAPGRQIGVQLRGKTQSKRVAYNVGMFNGNGFANNNNDDNDFLYAGRLAVYPSNSENSGKLEIGGNIAISQDRNSSFGRGFVQNFDGKRTLLGGDFRWVRDTYLLSGEIIYAKLKADTGFENDIMGFHLTGGYMLNRKSQLLLRFDSLEPDQLQADSHLLIFGYNLWPTQATELQVNYIISTDNSAFDNHQILANAQIGF